LYQHWQQFRRDGITFSKDEAQKTTAELRNSIRSIEWDLEDLEDTIGELLNHKFQFPTESPVHEQV